MYIIHDLALCVKREDKLLFSGGDTRPIPSPLGRGDRNAVGEVKTENVFCFNVFYLIHHPSDGPPSPKGKVKMRSLRAPLNNKLPLYPADGQDFFVSSHKSSYQGHNLML